MDSNEIFIKIAERTRQLERVDCFAGTPELSKTEYRLLREVLLEGRKGGKIISSEIARRIGVTRSAISQIVTKLEKENIIKRTPSTTDKKIAYVELTEFAAASFEKRFATANTFMKKVIAVFGEERMQALIAEYDELFRAIEEVKREIKEESNKEGIKAKRC